MTIQEAKDYIINILAKQQGLTLIELYDNFVREYKGELKTENKKFQDILKKLISEGKVVEVYSYKKDENIYYSKQFVKVDIPFFGIPNNCWHCRFGIIQSELDYGYTASPRENSNESQTLLNTAQEHKYACLLNPELKIFGSSEFSTRYQRRFKCPLDNQEE